MPCQWPRCRPKACATSARQAADSALQGKDARVRRQARSAAMRLGPRQARRPQRVLSTTAWIISLRWDRWAVRRHARSSRSPSSDASQPRARCLPRHHRADRHTQHRPDIAAAEAVNIAAAPASRRARRSAAIVAPASLPVSALAIRLASGGPVRHSGPVCGRESRRDRRDRRRSSCCVAGSRHPGVGGVAHDGQQPGARVAPA